MVMRKGVVDRALELQDKLLEHGFTAGEIFHGLISNHSLARDIADELEKICHDFRLLDDELKEEEGEREFERKRDQAAGLEKYGWGD